MVTRTKETPELPAINVSKEVSRAGSIIKKAVSGRKRRRVLIGLSGGVDSSVLAALAGRALEPENVYGLQLTHAGENELRLKDAPIVARHLRMRFRNLDITEPVDILADILKVPFHGEEAALRRSQIVDRLRTLILMDVSEQEGMVYLPAVNRTDLALGLGMIGGSFTPQPRPLAHLYKTYIFEMAEFLELPEQVLIRQPSAELWRYPAESTDMRALFREVDKLLYLRLEKKLTPSKIRRHGFGPRLVNAVLKRLEEVAAGHIQ